MSITDKTVLKMENTKTENIKIQQKKIGIKTDRFYGPVTLTALGLLTPIKISADPLQTKLMAVVGVYRIRNLL